MAATAGCCAARVADAVWRRDTDWLQKEKELLVIVGCVGVVPRSRQVRVSCSRV